MIELQSIVFAPGNEMQTVAHPPQVAFAVDQPIAFLLGNHAEVLQYLRVARTELAFTDPHGRLQIAQTSRRRFQIGFEIVIDVVEATMAVDLLVAFGFEKLFRRPQSWICHDLVEFPDQLGDGAGAVCEQAAFECRRRDGNVFLSFGFAIFDGSYAVPDIQVEIEQQPHERLDLIPVSLRVVGQDQKVDVRCWVQLTTPVAADRKQREVVPRARTELRLPKFYKQLIEETNPLCNDIFDIFSSPIAAFEFGVCRGDAASQGLNGHRSRTTLQSAG